MDLGLAGKIALVTGASRGIGRAIAGGLAAEGARLVIAARGAEALEEARRDLESSGAEVLAVPTDVGDDASVATLVDAARAHFGRIDILISNASALAVTGDRASWDASLGYTAAKAALNAFAKKLAVVEGSNGIRANALLPGSIEFPGGGWDMMRQNEPAIYEMVRQSIPAGRLGTPQEVAEAAVWLVSPRAAWVNGAALVVDGAQSKAIR